ncbi:hypothetical protein MY4824_007535 [Beauveria thailandica]
MELAKLPPDPAREDKLNPIRPKEKNIGLRES